MIGKSLHLVLMVDDTLQPELMIDESPHPVLMVDDTLQPELMIDESPQPELMVLGPSRPESTVFSLALPAPSDDNCLMTHFVPFPNKRITAFSRYYLSFYCYTYCRSLHVLNYTSNMCICAWAKYNSLT
jgi:hypothetical protein